MGFCARPYKTVQVDKVAREAGQVTVPVVMEMLEQHMFDSKQERGRYDC